MIARSAPELCSGPARALRLAPRAALVLCLLAAAGQALGQSASKEYQIKAAFLYNFSKFVDWPAETFADNKQPLVIGIAGSDPFGSELRKVAQGRSVKGRPFVIQPVKSIEEARRAQILFFAGDDEPQIENTLKAVQTQGVLTVGESEHFLKLGGVIRFVPAGDKIHFDINMAAAERGHLKVSSQLQKLAQTVQR